MRAEFADRGRFRCMEQVLKLSAILITFFVLRIGTAFEKAAVVVQIVLESKINISVCYFT